MKTNKIKNGRAADDTASRDWSVLALSTVTKLNNIIGFLPIDLDGVVKVAVDEVYALFHPDLCCIHLQDEQENFRMAACRSVDGPVPNVHVSDHASACAALRDGFAYIACDVPEARLRYSGICPNCRIPGYAPVSHACIPMISGNDQLGVMSISFRSGKVLSRVELDVLLSMANQVSAAIQRFRLFEKLRSEKAEIERAYAEIRDLVMEVGEAHKRFVESEKLAATGELAAGLCHEINNPIGIILNRIECLKMEAKDTALPQSLVKDLDAISLYAAKVSSLVQDLLVFSRHHPAAFEQMNLAPLLERIAAMYRDELQRRNCRLRIDLPGSLPDIRGDADRLEQVFVNLISNAMDSMPAGGNIWITALPAPEQPGSLEISVRDEGTGIDENNLHRIFDPFFTTKKIGKGTGLGLSICFGIIKSHGGDIRVEKGAPKGTVFIVSLPLSDPRNGQVKELHG